jgi:hypothetical protein
MERVSLEEHSLAIIKTPHRSQEAYQKEKGMERVSLEEHSLAMNPVYLKIKATPW